MTPSTADRQIHALLDALVRELPAVLDALERGTSDQRDAVEATREAVDALDVAAVDAWLRGRG